MNRRLIEFKNASDPHIVISFSDDKRFFPKIKENDGCFGILRLEVFDWDGAHLNSLFCDGEPVPEDKIFNIDHAKQILEFVDQCINEVGLVISQCDLGISRSSANAAALSCILNRTDGIFFKPPYYPNRLIYRTILDEFMNNVKIYSNICNKYKNY